MSAFNITVEGGKTVRLPTAGTYCDRDIIVTANGGDSIGAWKFIVDEISSCDHLSIVNGVLYCTDEWAHYVCKDAMGDVGYADSETPFDLSVLDKGKTYYIVDGDVGENRGTLVFDVNASYDVVRNQDITITENGVYNAGNGYTGLGKVTVSVPQTGGVAVGGVNKLPQVVDRSVTEITFDDLRGASEIGDGSLSCCGQLEKVEVPDSVKIIRANSLVSGSLMHLVMEAHNPPVLEEYAFDIAFLDYGTVSVPYGAKNTYMNATNWCNLNIVERENTGGGSTGGEEQWLFKDEYIDLARTDLPKPVVGVSYTCFVNGEEIGTDVCIEDPFYTLSFVTEDWRVRFNYCAEEQRWYFDDNISETLSGTVSIRING